MVSATDGSYCEISIECLMKSRLICTLRHRTRERNGLSAGTVQNTSLKIAFGETDRVMTVDPPPSIYIRKAVDPPS